MTAPHEPHAAATEGPRAGRGRLADTYIVRIYRREEAGPQPLVGMVEEIGVEGQRAFRTLAELGAILTERARRSAGKPRGRSRKRPAG